MPTAWFVDNLVHYFSTGNQTSLDLLIAKGDEFHKEFKILKETGNLEGKGLQYVLDIMQSYVVLTALPQEWWNKETKHICICRSFFKHGACKNSASMAMLMGSKLVIPNGAVLKKLQRRQRRGKEPTTSVGKPEGPTWSKDKRVCKLPTVSAVLTVLVTC